MNKRCLRCGKNKSIIYFGPHSSNEDGYQIWCKDCTHKYAADNYQKHAEDKKAQVSARRDKVGRLLDKVKAKNPCSCGEGEPLCLSLFPLSKKTPKVTKNSGFENVKKALAGSAVICSNCRIKVDAGLLAGPTQPLSWSQSDIEALEPKPVEPTETPSRKEAPRPALPPGVSLGQ